MVWGGSAGNIMYLYVHGGYTHTHTQFLSCVLYISYASNFLTNIFKWSLHHATVLIIICHSLLEGHEIHRACALFSILKAMGTYLPTVQMRVLRCGIFRQRHHYRLYSLRLDWQVSWWVQTVNRDLWHLCPLSWHYLCDSQRLGLDTLLKLPKVSSSHSPATLPRAE